MNSKFTLLSILFIFSFFACEEDENTVQNPSDCLIKQMVLEQKGYESSGELNVHTKETNNFFYNDAHRIQMITSEFDLVYSKDSLNLSNSVYKDTLLFSYNIVGNITRSKMISTSFLRDLTTGERTYQRESYESAFRDSQDVIVEQVIDKIEPETAYNLEKIGDKYTYAYDNNGNVVNFYRTVARASPIQILLRYDSNSNLIEKNGPWGKITSSIEYDNKINPFKKINRHLGFPYFWGEVYFYSNNNILKAQSQAQGEIICNYEFDNVGRLTRLINVLNQGSYSYSYNITQYECFE